MSESDQQQESIQKPSYATAKHNDTTHFKALAWVLFSFVTSAAFTASIHFITEHLPPLEVAFFRNLFALISSLPFLFLYGLKSIRTTQMKWHIVRALLGLTGMSLWFTCLKYIDLPTATLIIFTAPILAVFLASIFLKEKVTLYTIIALVLGVVGILIIKNPFLIQIHTVDILLLITIVAFAFIPLVIRKLSMTESSFSIMFYFGLFMTVFSIVPLFIIDLQMPTMVQWIGLVIVGILGFVFQYSRNEAIAKTSVSVVSSFQFTEPLFGTGIGYLVFNEKVGANILFGAIFIISAGLISAKGYREKAKQRKEQQALEAKQEQAEKEALEAQQAKAE